MRTASVDRWQEIRGQGGRTERRHEGICEAAGRVERSSTVCSLAGMDKVHSGISR